MDGWMDGCMDVWMDGCMDVWMYVCMNVWMYECMDGWMDGCMDVYVCVFLVSSFCSLPDVEFQTRIISKSDPHKMKFRTGYRER